VRMAKGQGLHLKTLVGSLLAVGLVVIPWHAWAFRTYGFTGTLLATPTVADAPGGRSLPTWLYERVVILAGTLFPMPLADKIGKLFEGATPDFSLYNSVLRYDYDTLPGAISTAMIAFLVFLAVKNRRSIFNVVFKRRVTRGFFTSPHFVIWLFVGLTIVGGVLISPGLEAKGIVGPYLVPAVVAILIYLSWLLSREGSKVRTLILTVLVIEFLSVRGVHSVLLAAQYGPVLDANLKIKVDQNLVLLWDYAKEGHFLALSTALVFGLSLLVVLLRWGRRPV